MSNDSGSDAASSSDSDAKVALNLLPLHSTNLLTVLNSDGVIQYESPSIERVFGYDQEELIGEQVAEYFHPADRNEVLSAFQAVVTNEDHHVEAVDYRHETADRSYVWVESVASANPTPAGHYVVNTRDISDQKERERHLEQTIARLEEFASVVSHDLRNPLSVAQGNLELSQEECDSDHLDRVATAHTRMETLIEDLLTLSQAGSQISEVESVALDSISKTCWQSVVTVDGTLSVETNRRIQADRRRLQQLLENLFRNAVEHAGEGVNVTVGEIETGFFVEDDGQGIPEEERDNIFETGYSTAETGTGFGLSIVKQIVDAHDWRIRITDGTDGGARFEISDIEFPNETT